VVVDTGSSLSPIRIRLGGEEEEPNFYFRETRRSRRSKYFIL
jgi:hypothetical protein